MCPTSAQTHSKSVDFIPHANQMTVSNKITCMHLEFKVVPPLNDKYIPLVSAIGDVYSCIPTHVQCDEFVLGGKEARTGHVVKV